MPHACSFRRTRFRPSWVLFLVAAVAGPGTDLGAQEVPTPESVLGFRPGADFHLASYDEALEYFQQLSNASDRVRLVEVGRTTRGLPWHLALISSRENLEAAERYREISRRLARPGEMTEAEARRLATEGKAIVHIDGGLHSTEVAHAQHAVQLAYDLATGDGDPLIEEILDEVILVLWFSINPDGQNQVVEWYRSNLGTPFEVAPMVELYQEYVGHDNNRDGYMINMIESRVTTRVIRHWEPQILYNHHQTAPFPARIWIPPFAEPISEHAHPLMWRTVNLLGMRMAHALEERDQPGAMHMGTLFDNWYPGFIDHANNFHNVAAFLTETGLYRYATPHFYTVDDFPERARDLRPESLYPSPWEGGWWRLQDAVDYMLTASIATLDVAAKYRESLLFNRWKAGTDVMAKYRAGPPYAYFVPQRQRDPVAPVELLRRMAFNDIEVHQLEREVSFEGSRHPEGTWVILMDQPNANFVRQVFDVQRYPDLREYPEGPPEQPYDVAGWTLPYQMDVRVVEARSPLDPDIRAALRPVEGPTVAWNDEGPDASAFDSAPGVGFDTHPVAAGVVPPAGRITGGGAGLALDPAQNNAFRALNRAWAEGGGVRFQPGVAGAEGAAGTSGRWVVTGLSSGARDALVNDLHLQAEGASVAGTELSRPRIGLYRPWRPSMDEGWTRWALERYGFEVSSLYNADVAAGELRERYDVILLPDIPADQILNGFDRGTVPPRFAGGLDGPGVRALDHFVRAGGTLVALNEASEFAIERLHLPVRNVVKGLDRTEFFLAGSIVEMEVDPSHPVMGGMPERAPVVVSRSPIFELGDDFSGSVLARYPAVGSPLLSGYLLGEEHLQGKASAVEVRHGQGRVILLGMKPQWRGQPFGNFRILFNSVLFTQPVAESFPGNPGFLPHGSPPATVAEEDAN